MTEHEQVRAGMHKERHGDPDTDSCPGDKIDQITVIRVLKPEDSTTPQTIPVVA